MSKLKTEFRKWHKAHANPFTPKIITLQRRDNKIIELAKSRRDDFYGVSVWEDSGNECINCKEEREKHNQFESVSHDLAQSFHDKEEALEYAQLLDQKFKDYNEIKEIVEKVERQVEE